MAARFQFVFLQFYGDHGWLPVRILGCPSEFQLRRRLDDAIFARVFASALAAFGDDRQLAPDAHVEFCVNRGDTLWTHPDRYVLGIRPGLEYFLPRRLNRCLDEQPPGRYRRFRS